MVAELYPFLTALEQNLESPWALEKHFLWGIGKDVRNAKINSTISRFDHQLQLASADDLAAYAEGLKPHLQKAMEYRVDRINTDYQNTLVVSHKIFSFAFFALIVREYDRKKVPLVASDYAVSAGIENISDLFSEVCQTANDWGIIHTPTIMQLLTSSHSRRKRYGSQSQSMPREEILKNPTAVTLLRKMVDAGKLDTNYQWKGKPTHYEMAAYAKVIADEARIGRNWPSRFADFWPEVSGNEITAKQLTRGLNEGVHSNFIGDAKKVLGLLIT